jgi:hypothetical protein
VFREPSKSLRYTFTLERPPLFPFWEEPCPSWEEFGENLEKAKEKMDRMHEHHMAKVGGKLSARNRCNRELTRALVNWRNPEDLSWDKWELGVLRVGAATWKIPEVGGVEAVQL